MKFLRKVTEMPWLEPGIPEGAEAATEEIGRPKMVALSIFLAVVTSVFFLFAVAYYERMELDDWNPVKEPMILWINTLLLVIGSVAMQRARNLVSQGRINAINLPLAIAGLMVIGFLIGQYMAWQALLETGLYSASNPAAAFFYVLTALHGIHLAGGLYVWARTLMRSLAGGSEEKIRVSIELCSVYWHYLLLVWLLLFALMLNT